MAIVGGLEEIDRGWNGIVAAMKTAVAQRVIDVGIVGDGAAEEHAEDGMTNARLATMHEYGSIKVKDQPPERSFLRSTIDVNRAKYEGLLKRAAKQFFERKRLLTSSLNLIGARVTADVQNTIRRGIPPPLADSTIRQKTVGGKKGTTPLIDTGQMIGALTWIVRKPSQGDR